MRKKDRLLTDLKHWFGWIISAFTIFGTLWLFKVTLKWYVIAVTFVVLVTIDVIKHKVHLQ